MANRLVLAIDNSIDRLNLALASGEGLIDERSIKEARSPSQILPENVSAILRENGRSIGDITNLIVTLGPGSFTGIRVALSFCKGIHVSTGIPVTGIPTLDALAFALIDREGSYLCPLIDAKKGEVFLSLYHVSNGSLERLTGYGAVKPEEVLQTVRTPCIFFGTGTGICRNELSHVKDITVIEGEYDNIAGGVLTDKRLTASDAYSKNPLQPIYGRRSEAEIKFNVTID